MTGQQLRNSILQEAVHGRLVPNVLQPGEKTGEELLKDILAERQKKENEEKGKKAKKLSLSTIEEEPWELPEGWCWTKIGDVCSFTAGQSPDGNDINEQEGVEFHQGKIYFGDIYLRQASVFTKKVSKIAHENSVLLCMRAPVGDVNITQREICIGRGLSAIEPYAPISSIFLLYWLKSYKAYFEERATGSTFKAITGEIVKEAPIPLPPLSIQKAIVEKIEELLPLIDEYDKAAVKLETLNKILPDKLRKSVLQEAIHGTLVPNDIPEGEATAPELLRQILKERQERENKEKGKKAKKIILSTIDEEPWVLPEGWCWCRLGDLGEFSRGNGIKKDEVIPEGYPCVRYGELYTRYRIQFSTIASHVNESVYRRSQKVERGDVVMALTGENEYDIALASVYLGTEPVAMGGDMTKLHPYVDSKFLVYTINSPYGIECKSLLATGQIIVHISNDKLASIPIPLPPLTIQQRIVEKIEEVFSVIDKLTASKDSE